MYTTGELIELVAIHPHRPSGSISKTVVIYVKFALDNLFKCFVMVILF